MKTEQETFDHVVAHIRAQGYERSMLPSGYACAYRGAAGRKCAVGCLIDDSHFSPSLEGHSVGASTVLAAVAQSGWNADMLLLRALQYAHDRMHNHPFEESAAKIAWDHGLTYTPPV